MKTPERGGTMNEEESDHDRYYDETYRMTLKDKKMDDTLIVPKGIDGKFAKFVQLKRHELGLSRHKLARISGVHRTTIVMMETKQSNPTIDSCFKLLRGMELNFTHFEEWLTVEPETPEPIEECKKCHGYGSIVVKTGKEVDMIKCPYCHGTGKAKHNAPDELPRD